MTEVIDLRQDFITAKSKEKVVAFAGFRLTAPQIDRQRDGLIAVSSRRRSDGSGYITLTFMIDTENDGEANQAIVKSFKGLRKEDLNVRLGEDFGTMIETSVDFDRNENWFMDSFTFYFDHVDKIKRYHIEGKLVPTFEALLPAKIDSVEWLPEDASVPPPGSSEIAAQAGASGFRKFLNSLFGGR
ncbi:MAG: hypothetical protein RBS57_22000 [Desulforhabdus sp.]|jgi:hypothetical protein|nr:hypothetical protein [Desulforhabdus sp.]